MVWSFLHKLSSPKWFYSISGVLLRWFTSISLLLLIVGVVWGLAFAPADYLQGNSFRIIYIHVPSALLAQSSYVLMAACGGVLLVWRIKLADVAMKTCAPIGASITFLALATGAIWGAPTWGTWWEWDARLTSTLVLFFLFIGVIALRDALSDSEQAGKACAVLALVGVVNIPIIKYSVEWWSTLHQTSTFTLTEKPAMPIEMWFPLLIMVLGFYAFFAAAWMMSMRAEILLRETKQQWVRALIDEPLPEVRQ